MHIRALPDLSRPLLDKFYKAHRSPMRGSAEAQAWVVQEGEIIAALSMTAVEGGHWLTGLFVAPHWRGQSVARRLIDAAVTDCGGTAWLFCHPELTAFYARLNFTAACELPDVLAEKLARYSRTKPLVALSREQAN
jgi:GNAT superfamily N-acetyltransferase